MSRAKILIIILIIAMGGLATWLIIRQNNNTLKNELSDFAVADTANIDMIFLADKNKNTILLERKSDGSWSVNGTYEAKPDAINYLMKTIYGVQVKAPVGRASFNSIIKRLSMQSTKVEIYQKRKLVKTYYVGTGTQDMLGTYMMIENSSTPFITWIPGFEGYLTPRYSTQMDAWRNTPVFRLKPEQIAEVSIRFDDNEQLGWRLTRKNNYFEFFGSGNEPLAGLDTLKARDYFTRFVKIHYEAIINDFSSKDSLLDLKPKMVFSLTETNGNKTEIKCYPKRNPVPIEEIMSGNAPPIDPDRFYAIINNNEEELLLMQFYVFDNLLVNRKFFLR
jgi:hypothetical protein